MNRTPLPPFIDLRLHTFVQMPRLETIYHPARPLVKPRNIQTDEPGSWLEIYCKPRGEK